MKNNKKVKKESLYINDLGVINKKMLTLTDIKEYLTCPSPITEETIRHISNSFRWGVLVFNINGIWLTIQKPGIVVDDILIVDKIAEMFVLGCTVDYVREFGGSYLQIN